MAEIARVTQRQRQRHRNISAPIGRNLKLRAQDKVSSPCSPVSLWENDVPLTVIDIHFYRGFFEGTRKHFIAKRSQWTLLSVYQRFNEFYALCNLLWCPADFV